MAPREYFTLENVVIELSQQTEVLEEIKFNSEKQTSNLKKFTDVLLQDRKQREAQQRENSTENAGTGTINIDAREMPKPESSMSSSFGGSFGKLAGIGAGLGALGLGISAFFGGLALGDKGLSFLNTDMSALKRTMVGLGEAFSATDTKGLVAMGGLIAAGGAMGALLGPGGSLKAGFGMFAIGAGIGAFFAGLAINDAAIQKFGGDGSGIASLMKNTAEGLGAFANNVGSTELFAGLLATGALFGQVPGAAFKGAVGMGLIGAGIGAFFAALAASSTAIEAFGTDGSGLKNLMKNTAEGLAEIAKLGLSGMASLVAFGPAAISASVGLVALLGAQGLSSITDTLGDVLSFFTSDDDKPTIFENISVGLSKLMGLDYSNLNNLNSFGKVANGVDSLGRGLNNLAETDFSDLTSNIKEIAESTAFAIPLLNAMWEGGPFKHEGSGVMFDDEYDFGVGLKNTPVKEIGQAFDVIGTGISGQRTDAIAEGTKQMANLMSSTITTVIGDTNTQSTTLLQSLGPALTSPIKTGTGLTEAYNSA